MLTPGGKYRIIDLNDFLNELPNSLLPLEWLEEADKGDGQYFFFFPAHWNEENGWCSWTGQRRNFPMLYSPGFETREEALAEATKWEEGEEVREARKLMWTDFSRD
ncbi:MAG: hypothetical protein JSU72_15230 [Deltaproteobacteria bacterium]|nr:MAG: hypothetical protein JSU72_15230 [Deltaproteobacteria bacterium]